MDEVERLRAEVKRTRRWEMLPGLIAMSLIAIMGFAIVCLFLIPMPMTDAAGTLAVALVTAVTTNVGVIVGFFFGSSKDNKEKDATILAQAQSGTPVEVAKQVAAAVTAATTTNGAAETQAWTEATAANTIDAFNGYVAKFPAGVHAAEAQARIVGLQNP